MLLRSKVYTNALYGSTPPSHLLNHTTVYETSLFLSIIFENYRQPPSIIPHLIPSLYQSSNCSDQPLRQATIVLSLLHHLATTYPSQSTYRTHFKSIPETYLPRTSKAYNWIASLTRSLRTRNYTQFDRLSRLSSSSDLPILLGLQNTHGILSIESLTNRPREAVSAELAYATILTTLDTLRTKARESFWVVVRSAYRELGCTASAGDTREWLSRSLCLEAMLSAGDRTMSPEEWLDGQVRVGGTRRKEGVEGRWVVCKAA